MGIKDAVWKTTKWKIMKRHLGYTGEEMEIFRENPRNVDVLEKVPTLMGKTIVVEVVDSHGCNSRHEVGDIAIIDTNATLHSATPIEVASGPVDSRVVWRISTHGPPEHGWSGYAEAIRAGVAL